MRSRRVFIWIVLPLSLYLLAAIFITWPLVTHLESSIAGAGYGDTYEVIRGTWWTREAIQHGDNPFHHTYLIYPDSYTSWIQWAHPFEFVIPTLLTLIVSPVAAVNLTLILTLALNGYGAYWLGMYLSGRRIPAALLGGLVFAAYPTIQGHLSGGHLSNIELAPLPLFALCLLRIARDNAGWKTVLWGAVWFLLTAISFITQPIYLLFPLLLLVGLYLLLWERHQIFRHDIPWRDQPWIKLVAMVGLGAFLLLPFFLPMVLVGGDEVSGVEETGRVTYSADPMAFVSPSPFGFFKDEVPQYTRDVLGTNSVEGTAYLGLIALMLASIALWFRPSARIWGFIALGAMIFSLGPLLKWRDDPVTVHVENFRSYVLMPWSFFQQIPFISNSRAPGRFNLVTGLAMSALVSVGAAVVLERIRRREIQMILTVAAGVVILIEYQLFWPFITIDSHQSSYWNRMASEADVRAVLDVPTNHSLVSKLAVYEQTEHEQPLIAGHVLRRTIQNPALLAVLDRAATGTTNNGLPIIRNEDVPYLLSQAGADRLVVHKRFLSNSSDIMARLITILGQPTYEEEAYAVFAVPRTPTPPPDFSLAGATSGFSEMVNIGDFEAVFLGDEGEWYFYADQEVYGDFVFHTAPYRMPRRVGIWLDDEFMGGWWADAGEVHLPVWVDRGYHTIRFESLDGCTEYPFMLTCFASNDLAGDCAPLDPPACISVAFETATWTPAESLPTALDVSLDYGLRLHGYEILDHEDSIQLRLFWEAEGALPHSYALFAHIANPETGEPVQQYDGYPFFQTDEWHGGAHWVSDITIPKPAEAGTYAINVGWFRQETNDRITVQADRPWASAGVLHLQMVEIE